MPLLTEQSRRRRNLVIIGALLILAAAATAVNFEMRVPQLPLATNIVVFALFNLNLIVFLLLLVLLIRNLVKLWFERRQQLIGAKFKTKLVLSFLALSLAPAVLIFIIASNFINKSIEGWFKPQVERPLAQALAVAQTYYPTLQATALRHAQHVARVIDRDGLLGESRREALAAYLVEQQEQLGLAALTVFAASGQELVHAKDSGLADLPTRDVNESQLRLGLGGQAVTTVRELSSGDLIEAIVPVVSRDPNRRVVGAVVVGTHVTERLEAKIRGIEQSFQEYKQLKLEARRRYMETVLEAITTGVVSLDPQNRITTVNRAAATMFGLNEHTMVGRSIDQAFVGPDLRDVVALAQRIQRGRAATVEQALQLRRNGARVSLLASGTTLRGPEGEYGGLVIVFDDLT